MQYLEMGWVWKTIPMLRIMQVLGGSPAALPRVRKGAHLGRDVSEPKRFTALVMAGSRARVIRSRSPARRRQASCRCRRADAATRPQRSGPPTCRADCRPWLDPQHVQRDWDSTRPRGTVGGRARRTVACGQCTVAIETLGLEPDLDHNRDHPLLTAAMVDEFCGASLAAGGDVTLALPTVRASPRCFRASAGPCTAFGRERLRVQSIRLLSPEGRAARTCGCGESYRKQPWRMVAILGCQCWCASCSGACAQRYSRHHPLPPRPARAAHPFV